MRVRFRRPLLAILLLASFRWTGDAAVSPRHVPFWACSDGKGTVSLFWLPPDGRWPAGGFRLDRVSGGKTVELARNLLPERDTEAMALLDPADAEAIRLLAGKIRNGSLTDEDRNSSITVMGRNAAMDSTYGRALGVRYTDRTRGAGKRKYRLTGVSADGWPDTLLESNDVDPRKRTPGPSQPAILKAEPREDGVALFWPDSPADGIAPVVAYHVERVGPGRKTYTLTQIPLSLKKHLSPGLPDFVDAGAPRETMTYRVTSVDVFGRRSAQTQARVQRTDFPVPAPPEGQTAGATISVEIIQADAPSAASTPASPPAPATPAPPPVRATPASPPAPATPAPTPARATPATPPAPASVAQAKNVIVPPAAKTAAGPGDGRKEPASSPVAPEAKKEPAPSPVAPKKEPVGIPAAETRAETGKAVEEPKRGAPERAAPPTPLIASIYGMDGKVTIIFMPGPPEDVSREFLVLRSDSAMGPGRVIGRPLPPETRKWEDTSVDAGQNFWYRLVAVDKDGNRSLPTTPHWIRVTPR